jgi:hypothetical protein
VSQPEQARQHEERHWVSDPLRTQQKVLHVPLSQVWNGESLRVRTHVSAAPFALLMVPPARSPSLDRRRSPEAYRRKSLSPRGRGRYSPSPPRRPRSRSPQQRRSSPEYRYERLAKCEVGVMHKPTRCKVHAFQAGLHPHLHGGNKNRCLHLRQGTTRHAVAEGTTSKAWTQQMASPQRISRSSECESHESDATLSAHCMPSTCAVLAVAG